MMYSRFRLLFLLVIPSKGIAGQRAAATLLYK
jgi:hypothetical protein